MRIELEKLKESGGQFSKIYNAQDLALDDRDATLIGPVEVQGRISRQGAEIKLHGEVRALIEVPCARCLKPVQLPIESKFAERFVPVVSWRAEEQHELLEEDLSLAVFDGEAIELEEVAREEILLALPDHVLCREDCKGLCSRCGTDKNLNPCACGQQDVDARWEKLRELRF